MLARWSRAPAADPPPALTADRPPALTADRAAVFDVGILLALAVVVGGCLIVAWEARHSTFTGDDWTFILQRRGFSADIFLRPDNEHLSAIPILAYKLLLAVFGMSSYAPFIALLVVVHGIAGLLLYALARRYVGPWTALVPTAIVAVLGPAWQDLLFFGAFNHVAAVTSGLGMVLCLERRDRRGDVGAGALLGVSLLCSSIGLTMVVFAAVLIALQRPLRWRRLWAVGVPVGVYLLWYAFYGVSTINASNIPKIPGYVFHAASAAMASVTGLGQTHVSPFLVSTTYGRFILIAAVGFFIFYLARGGKPPALTWAALATALALWTAEALEYFPNGREAEQSRYQYAAAMLVLLAVASAANGWRPAVRGRVILASATLAVCAANIGMLHDRTGFWSENSSYDRAETGALEVTRGIVSSDFSPENAFTLALAGNHGIFVINAGPYFSAVDSFGSAADRPRQILDRPEKIREAADAVVGFAERLGLVPAVGVGSRGSVCRSARTGSRAGELVVGPGSLTVRDAAGSTAQLELRRFASSFRFVHYAIPGGTAVALRLPADRASVPWHVRVLGGVGVRLCAAAPPGA